VRALVTGGAGFLGSHVCDYLLGRGWQVVSLDNMSTGAARNVRGRVGLTSVQHDVVEPFASARGLWGPFDVIFHLASPASPFHYLKHPAATMRAAVFGTYNALEYAQQQRCRILIASSSEVYGDPLVHPQPETYWGNVNSVGPRAVYGEGKRYAEAMTTVFRGEGVDTCIARPFNAYGPRLNPHDGRVVPSFLRQALAGEPLVVYGDGSQTRSLCYVGDLVRGLYLLALSNVQEPVNLGNPHEVSMLELAETVIRVTGSSSRVEFGPLPTDDPVRRCPDIARAQQLLGWSPTVPLEQGLALTATAFRDLLETARG
jgi:dTDP-glucose 4,6-dehydratase